MVVFVSTFFGFIALGVYVGAFSIFNPLFLIYFQHNSLIPYRSSERLTGTVHSLNILFHYHSQNLSMNLAKLQVFASHPARQSEVLSTTQPPFQGFFLLIQSCGTALYQT